MAALVPAKVFVQKYDYQTKKLPLTDAKTIVVLSHTTTSTLGGSLSPYHLCDEQGRCIENLWQFSKVYRMVTGQRIPLNRYVRRDTIIWDHPAQVHVSLTGEHSLEYWNWRKKGMASKHAIRYPNGFYGRRDCMYALWPTSTPTEDTVVFDGQHYEKLSYIASRKKIYCALYAQYAPVHWEFLKIKEMMNQGKDIIICEVDGPNPLWYKGTPIEQYFTDKGLEINQTVIEYLINDPAHPFGHGYTLAALFLDGADWLK
jgi:hypothetical protein